MENVINEVDRTAREPNYYGDMKYGEVGEMDFEKNCFPKFEILGYTMFDVRSEKKYQHADIDYVISKNGCAVLPDYCDVIYNKDYVKVEVKIDGVAIRSGNLAYEAISHSNLGWSTVTKCDFVYFVLTDESCHKIWRRAWVDMEKWNEYCSNRKFKKKLSVIKSENGIVDLLCNINDLERNGVLKWFKPKTESDGSSVG